MEKGAQVLARPLYARGCPVGQDNGERNMSTVAGIYRIPSIKHVILVTGSLLVAQEGFHMTEGSTQDREDFRRILRMKHTQTSIEGQPWIATTIDAGDFLAVLGTQVLAETVESGRTSDPQDLDFIALNLTQTPENSKILSKVSDNDLIEVFI